MNTANDYASALQLYASGHHAKALDKLAPLLRAQHPDALNLGAVCLRLLHRPREAEALLRRLIDAMPSHADAHCNLGNLLRDENRPDEAEAAYRRALALRPDYADGHYNLALLLQQNHRPQEAEESYRHTLALRPDCAETHLNLGVVLYQLGHPAQAQAMYQRALAINPGYADAPYNLGLLLQQEKRMAQAETAYRQALAIDPTHVNALNNLSRLLSEAGVLDEGIEMNRHIVAIDPHNALFHSNLAYALIFQAEDSREILEECKRWSARHEAPLRAARMAHDNDRTPGRRLRIGYVSSDFRAHCQSLFTLPVFSRHDHTQFEFFFYSSVQAPDPLTQRLADCADTWHDVHTLSDEQLAQRIREDRIDILVDLTMHMSNGRPLLFARKPAPVQIAWLAYPGTTGLAAMDYRLTDPWLDPPGTDGQYTERSIRLPDAFWCYDPQIDQPEQFEVNALPALEAGRITFASLNNPSKITDRTLRMWSAVLQRVKNSQLMLLTHAEPPHPRFLAQLQKHGIDLAQVLFAPFQPRRAYLRLYQQIDIALDTFPCNGHTTSLDAFWMGVPVVSRVGDTAVGRGGLSQLMNLGLGELAAHSDGEFIDIATQLAQDLPRLAALRQGLRSRLAQSPLMDGPRFARHLESIYRRVWQDWCQQEPAPAKAPPASAPPSTRKDRGRRSRKK